MKDFNVYDLIGRLADAVNNKKNRPAVTEAENKSVAEPDIPAAAPPKKKPFGADKAAVVEMLRRHDKKSREIDERIKNPKTHT